jgi:hypothetical protein
MEADGFSETSVPATGRQIQKNPHFEYKPRLNTVFVHEFDYHRTRCTNRILIEGTVKLSIRVSCYEDV